MQQASSNCYNEHMKRPLSETHPEAAAEWADEKKKPHEVSAGSDYDAQWKCARGHLYRKTVYQRATRDVQCPYCSNREVLEGFNDLRTTHPDTAEEWADSRDIRTVSFNSRYRAQWECSQGHTWTVAIRNRFKSDGSITGCPFCSGRRAVRGTNDLLTTHRGLVQEWNDARDARDFSRGSGYKACWKCSQCRQEYIASISNRALRNKGCPYCSGRKVAPGVNDLATTHPQLVQEWDDQREVFSVGAGSGYMAQWKCPQGHNWKAPVCNRARHKRASGCPACRFSKNRSASEVEILNYVKQLLPGDDVISSDRELVSPYEVDIYIPSKHFAIEFNGVYWHSENAGKDRLYHLKKQQMCRKQGVRLFTIWEDDYRRNPDLIRSMVAHKIGTSLRETVYARSTAFSSLSTTEGSAFMDENHLQQSHRVSRYYGLRSRKNSEIVAVMGVRHSKKKHEIEITRFATTKSVPGGFSKLLANILRTEEYNSAKKIVSYSHNDHSWGEVYRRNGFTKVHDGTPGYFYLVNSQREHRLNYSPKRFREREDLIFEEGMTERELAALNGLSRIWDCGSARWEKLLG